MDRSGFRSEWPEKAKLLIQDVVDKVEDYHLIIGVRKFNVLFRIEASTIEGLHIEPGNVFWAT